MRPDTLLPDRAAALTEVLAGQDPTSVWVVVGAVLVVVWATLRRASRRRPPPSRDRRPGGRATPARPRVGDVWWADVPFEDGTGSKDRPCVVVASRGRRCVVLSVTSTDRSGRPGWLAMPRQGWSTRPGTSWLRTGRRVVLDARRMRRYAGPCPPSVRTALGI